VSWMRFLWRSGSSEEASGSVQYWQEVEIDPEFYRTSVAGIVLSGVLVEIMRVTAASLSSVGS